MRRTLCFWPLQFAGWFRLLTNTKPIFCNIFFFFSNWHYQYESVSKHLGSWGFTKSRNQIHPMTDFSPSPCFSATLSCVTSFNSPPSQCLPQPFVALRRDICCWSQAPEREKKKILHYKALTGDRFYRMPISPPLRRALPTRTMASEISGGDFTWSRVSPAAERLQWGKRSTFAPLTPAFSRQQRDKASTGVHTSHHWLPSSIPGFGKMKSTIAICRYFSTK